MIFTIYYFDISKLFGMSARVSIRLTFSSHAPLNPSIAITKFMRIFTESSIDAGAPTTLYLPYSC